MVRLARARRNASAWSIAAVLVLAVAPSARAQFGAQLTPIFLASSYPGDWQKTNTLTNMQVFNGTQEDVRAEIKVTINRNGVPVGTTPNVQRIYPNGNSIVPTYNLTQWQTLVFNGKVGEGVDLTGRLPDGVYTICVDITNVTGLATGAQYTGASSCGTILSFTPKPPTPLFPPDGGTVTTPSPVFQWAPIMSDIGRRVPHLFRLVEVYPGQTPQRAIEANRAIWEDAFPKTFNSPVNDQSSFTYPAFAPPLVSGHRYAWRMQALYAVSGSGSGSTGISPVGLKARGGAASGLPVQTVGDNEGKSRVFTFTVATDPGQAKLEAAPDGASPEADTRMGNVWGPGGPDAGAGAAHDTEWNPNGASFSAQPAEPGAAEGVNFADKLARVMASLWKQGPAAAVSAARGRAPAADPRMSAAIPSPVVPDAGKPRVSRSSVDTRLAQGMGPAQPPPEPAAATPAPDSTAASAAPDSAAAQQASVSTPAPAPMGGQQSQGVGPDWARLHGTASLTGETYSSDGLAVPNRPDRSSRVVTGLSVGVLKDQMRIPVSALVSDDQVSFRQNINQVAVAPRFRWAGLTAGNFAPQFSSYTLADATIQGAGFELAPNLWRIGFVDGRARKAITPTADGLAITPQFARNVLAGRLGYGNPATNSLELSVMRANDDPNSIAGAESTITVTPEGNTVYALKAQGILPTRHIRAIVETALSRYDRDRRADVSTLDGHAVGVQIFHETSFTHTGLKAEYLNGGFMDLGNSAITGDRVDLGLTAGVQLMQGKLQLDGNAGARSDAVSALISAPTRRQTYGLNGSWQPSQRFGANAQMSIYANKATATDSLLQGSSNATRVYSVSPHTAWTLGHVQNTLACAATVQKSSNGGTYPDTKCLSLSGNWAAAVAAPLQVTLDGNYTKTDFQIAVTEQSAFGPGFTLAAFRSKLLTNALLQFTRSRTGNSGADTEFTPRMEMRWEFAPRQAVVFRGNFRQYKYAVPGTSMFDERTASIEYVTNL